MPDETRQIVQSYLQAPSGAFWKWGDAQTISWSKGWTIAFRQEIESVLSAIADNDDNGHPPMGAIVLVLAACRSVWPQENGGRQALLSYASAEGAENSPVLHRVLKGLDSIHALPPERISADAKADVLAALFEGYAGHSQTSRALAEQLRIGIAGLDVMRARAVAHPEYEFVLVLSALDSAFSKFDPRGLGLRKKTGLDQLPARASIGDPPELPPGVRVRQLIDELRDDRQLASLTRLARDVVAAIQLPRPVSAPDNLSTGGVSDITNRGTLDRLLISELAHDSLTLAVRVAVGEALYLRRESFPQVAQRHRFLLLDSGIRMWGVPRVFAAAVGMALGATTRPNDDLRAYRAAEDGVAPVDLTRRDSLIEHLTRLEAAPHPGAALPHFLKLARDAGGEVEAILITHSDTLADPDFIASLAARGPDSLYIATVQSSGRMQLVQITHAGRRVIKEVILKLDDLFTNPPDYDAPAVHATLLVSNDGLPAIYSEDPFPLLLPEQSDSPIHAQGAYGIIATRGRSVFHWAAKNKGARRLKTELPEGRIIWIGLDAEGVVRALVGVKHVPLKLYSYDLTSDSENLSSLGLTFSSEVSAWTTPDALCLTSDQMAFAYSLVDGNQVARLHLGAPPGHGRYFCDARGWNAITYAAGVLQIDRVATPTPDLVAVFETKTHACLALKRDGTLASWPDNKPLHKIALAGFDAVSELVAVSHDSDSIAVKLLHHPQEAVLFRCLLHLRQGLQPPPTIPISKWKKAWIDFNRPPVENRSLLHRFVAIEFTESGVILRSVRETQWRIGLNTARGELFFTNIPNSEGKSKTSVTFKDVQSPRLPRHISLRVATFRDGSRAFLDSRGLLHLISGDDSLPQVTFALAQSTAMAGWISDGRTFGDPYFFRDKTTATGDDAVAILRQFIRRLR